jgi:hypothetical protein
LVDAVCHAAFGVHYRVFHTLSRDAMNQVHVYAHEAREACGSKRFEGALRVVIALEPSQQVGTQGLDAETDAIDPSLPDAREQCRRGVGRVHLDTDLGLGRETRPQHRHDSFD